MIHVLASITIAPGRRDTFLTEFHAIVSAVRAEDGCIAYAPAVDEVSGISIQSAPRGDVVVVIEQWRDLAALQAHLVAPHMGAYRERVKDLVTGVQLQVLKPA